MKLAVLAVVATLCQAQVVLSQGYKNWGYGIVENKCIQPGRVYSCADITQEKRPSCDVFKGYAVMSGWKGDTIVFIMLPPAPESPGEGE